MLHTEMDELQRVRSKVGGLVVQSVYMQPLIFTGQLAQPPPQPSWGHELEVMVILLVNSYS